MADLSKISDADLKALAGGDLKSVSTAGLMQLKEMHDSEIPAPEPGTGSKILSYVLGSPVGQGIIKGAKALDSVTGAPMRAGIYSAQNSQSPADIPGNFASGFKSRFAENPDMGPSGEDIVKKGFGLEGTPAKIAGFGMDLAANPINFVGTAANAVGKGAELAGKIPGVGKYISSATDLPGNAATSLASKVSGIPKQAIKNYVADPEAVQSLVAQHGGELSVAADEMKAKVLHSVQDVKNQLNDKITNAIEATAPDKTVSSQPILEQLQKVQSGVNKHTNPADWQHIQSQIDTINSVAPNGAMDLKNLYDVKNYLQTQRYGQYQTAGGDLFQVSNGAKRAAGNALDVARETLHSEVPAIKDADSVFSKIHDIDNDMSSSLLAPGKSEQMFASAGGATKGYANQNYSRLKEIGNLTGTDPIKDAKTLYAAQQFNKSNMFSGGVPFAKEALKLGIDASTKTGVPLAIDNILEGIGSQSAAPILNPFMTPAYGKQPNAMQRRVSSQK